MATHIVRFPHESVNFNYVDKLGFGLYMGFLLEDKLSYINTKRLKITIITRTACDHLTHSKKSLNFN